MKRVHAYLPYTTHKYMFEQFRLPTDVVADSVGNGCDPPLAGVHMPKELLGDDEFERAIEEEYERVMKKAKRLKQKEEQEKLMLLGLRESRTFANAIAARVVQYLLSSICYTVYSMPARSRGFPEARAGGSRAWCTPRSQTSAVFWPFPAAQRDGFWFFPGEDPGTKDGREYFTDQPSPLSSLFKLRIIHHTSILLWESASILFNKVSGYYQ